MLLPIPLDALDSLPLIFWNIGSNNVIPKPSARPAIIVNKKDRYMPEPINLWNILKYLIKLLTISNTF